jgi:DNA-binding response OmpR family regulator
MSHPLHAQATYKMKALVVEDSEEVRESLSILLRSRGIQPILAGNAAAMDHFLDDDFDFVVTDLDVAATNGLELIRWIRARSPFLPVIIISGIVSGEGDSIAALSHTNVVRKPVGIEDLDAALSPILRQFHG